MLILTIASLVYVAILVLALAASLTLILYHLWGVRSVLSDVREALSQVEHRTQPLEPHLDQLHRAVERAAEHVTRARDVLGEVG